MLKNASSSGIKNTFAVKSIRTKARKIKEEKIGGESSGDKTTQRGKEEAGGLSIRSLGDGRLGRTFPPLTRRSTRPTTAQHSNVLCTFNEESGWYCQTNKACFFILQIRPDNYSVIVVHGIRALLSEASCYVRVTQQHRMDDGTRELVNILCRPAVAKRHGLSWLLDCDPDLDDSASDSLCVCHPVRTCRPRDLHLAVHKSA